MSGQANSTFDPEMLKMRQNLDISLFQGTVSATKNKIQLIHNLGGLQDLFKYIDIKNLQF